MYRFLVLLLVLLITGCSHNRAGEIDNSILVFSLGGDVSIINPILSSDTASSAVEGMIFSGLTKVNEKLEIIPDIAKRWTVSRDGRQYTFYLRDNVFWHDGIKLTSDDIKFTFDSILDPKVNSVRRGDFIIDGEPIRFLTDGPKIFKAVLPKPFAPFLGRIGMGILPKHVLYGKDINSSSFNQHPIGTGPFKFQEWVQSDHVTLVKNAKYYDGEPLLSKIVYKIIPDENSSLIALQAGEVDESGVPPKDYKRAKNNKKIDVYEYEILQYVFLGLNLANPLFQDINVRHALAYATNKDQLVNLIFRGLATPAYGPSSPVAWSYEKDVEKYNYDLAKAAALFEGAGWKLNKDGIREKDGKIFEFTILVNQGNKEREKAAVVIQWQYKKLGIKVNVRTMEWSAILRKITDPKLPREFDSLIIGWSLGIDPDSYSIWHSSQFPNGLNFINYRSPSVDRLLEEGRIETDKAKRKLIYSRIQKEIAKDQPYIFLWYPKAVSAVSKNVKGLSKPGPAGLFLNMEKIYKE